jgi:hypothetical protein
MADIAIVTAFAVAVASWAVFVLFDLPHEGE